MGTQKITDLLDRYLDGTATPAERNIVDAWYNKRIASRRQGRNKVIWGASLLLVAFGIGLHGWSADPSTLAPPAMLTSSEASHTIHTQTGAYRELSTPAAGQYRIALPDGSSVWLNCSTTLRYPVIFNKSERRIELSGEAWFDIARDPARPFVVVSGGTTTTVLGTSFNIMAYPDEAWIQTTLLSGKLQCGDTILDKPGQQAITSRQAIMNDQPVHISDTDTTAATAWKTGRFEFDEQPMPVIMRQLQRWYPIVAVDYTRGADTIVLSGSIARRRSLKALLDLLSQTAKVHFEIKEDHIIVRP